MSDESWCESWWKRMLQQTPLFKPSKEQEKSFKEAMTTELKEPESDRLARMRREQSTFAYRHGHRDSRDAVLSMAAPYGTTTSGTTFTTPKPLTSQHTPRHHATPLPGPVNDLQQIRQELEEIKAILRSLFEDV